MIKQNVKIIILFLTLLVIIVGGWQMYQRLNYDKLAFESDIYAYVSPQSREVIHLSRNHYLDVLYEYNDSFQLFLNEVQRDVSYPIIITTHDNEKSLLQMKVTREQNDCIEEVLEKKLAPYYSPKIIKYKDKQIKVYTLQEDDFLVSCNMNGIFAISKDLSLLQDFVDTDIQNNFFTTILGRKTIFQLINSSPICIFSSIEDNYLALNAKLADDNIFNLDGYLLTKDMENAKHVPAKELVYKMKLPYDYCIENITVGDTTDLESIKIELNKIL